MSRPAPRGPEPRRDLPGVRRSRFVAYAALLLGAAAVLVAFLTFKVRVFVAGGKFILVAVAIILVTVWVASRFGRR